MPGEALGVAHACVSRVIGGQRLLLALDGDKKIPLDHG